MSRHYLPPDTDLLTEHDAIGQRDAATGYWMWAGEGSNTNELVAKRIKGMHPECEGHVYVFPSHLGVAISACARTDAPSVVLSPNDALTLARTLIAAAGVSAEYVSAQKATQETPDG